MTDYNLDLADPVTLFVGIIESNFSPVPVLVHTEGSDNYYKGGYSGDKPEIIPVEGPVIEGVWRQRKGRTNLRTLPASSEITIYEVTETYDGFDLSHSFADNIRTVRVDIFHSESKNRLKELRNEVERCISKDKKNKVVLGNYSYIQWAGVTPLTNRKAGIFRYIIEYKLVGVSTYIGHA